MRKPTPVPENIAERRSLTIQEFCAAEGFSPVTYFKLRKAGHGPRELRLPGSSVVRITAEARGDWHRRIEELNKTEEARLDDERAARAARASKAGRKGAASPAHPCRRRARV